MNPLKHLLYTLNLAAILLLNQASNAFATETSPLVLHYDQPAKHWEEALPIGNGRLGAMIYGGVAQETLELNEDTFWAGGPHNNLNPKALEALPKIREFLNLGHYPEASKLAEQSITSQGAQGMPYQTAGRLTMHFDGHQNYTNYSRELDINHAVSRTRYQIGNTLYEREIFSSFVDQAIVVRLKASQKGALNFKVALVHPHDFKVSTDENNKSLLLQTRSSDHEGIKGQVELRNLVNIVHTDGTVTSNKQQLQVSDASEVTLLIAMATNFKSYQDISADAMARVYDYMSQATQQFKLNGYQERLQKHINFYKNYFDRVSLHLGPSQFSQETTDKRIHEFANRHDPELVALYFQFGRYLLISSSQPGTQPANLQGIWNHQSKPAWDSKYTLNINAEMNYWPSESTQLSELNEPFIQLIRELAQSGQESAKTMYGARGWMAHHNTDIWRISGAIDWSWGPWPTSNAWLVQHLWRKYLYSGDQAFLESVYPIMRSACDFFEDFLIEDPQHGWLVVSPSISPENEAKPTGLKIASGVSTDNQLLFDLFNHTIQAATLLNKDKKAIVRWQKILKRLPPIQIGQYHQIQEWQQDWDDPFDSHRHVSHLYGLHPGNQISPLRTPELFAAAKISLEQRGDPSTGWSMNWKINLWARLLDGNRALKLIRDQIKPASLEEGVTESGGTYPNMFDAHPPFQIDGNFGFTAGVSEMLAQSHNGSIFLLPALPQHWPHGEVKGLKMRGGFEVDMRWQHGQVQYLKVFSELGGNLRIRTFAPLPKPQGFRTKKAKGENNNPFYATPQINTPIKNTQLTVPLLSLDNTFLVDVKTQEGEEYIWKK